MATELRERALFLLRQALNQPSAEFRDGQWKERSQLYCLCWRKWNALLSAISILNSRNFAIHGGNIAAKIYFVDTAVDRPSAIALSLNLGLLR
jgi:hypothetical protein